MSGNLLIKTVYLQSLDAFVTALPRLIGCANWEERQSSSYVEERYYRCGILGLELTVAIADDAEFPDYEFWFSFQVAGNGARDKGFLDGLADCTARALVLHGYAVIRPFDMSRTGSGAVAYRLNPTVGTRPRERILTETICGTTGTSLDRTEK
jgi:hypothetical protein